MRGVCIIGSPNRKGSTAFLVNKVVEGMRAAGAKTQVYHLGDMNIGYCQGCRKCETTLRCVQRDDMDTLTKEIFASDVILLASPSYWGDVTGQMKVFIDRCTPLSNARTGRTPVPPGKRGIAVAIRAGKSKGENQRLLATMEHFFGHLGIQMTASLTAEQIEGLTNMLSKADKHEEAYCLGQRLVKYQREG